MNNKIKVTMHCEEDGFISHIMGLTGLDIRDKLGILEYAADEMFICGDNLKLLEYKLAIKELKEQEHVQAITDRQFTVKPLFGPTA